MPEKSIKQNMRTQNKLMQNIWRHRVFYFMLAPAVILLAIFAYQPMYGVTIAFKDYSFRAGILGSPWVGFKNFETIFELENFWNALRNTVIINLAKLIAGFGVPIMLAVMINSVKHKFAKKTVQTILYLPHFVSWVIIAGMLFSLFDERSGSLYHGLSLLGISVNPFGDGVQFIALLVLSDIWKEAGWGAIIYLAALAGISPEYYEAARIDGANTVQQFTRITLPLLMPTITIMLILQMGGLIWGNFDQIFNLYNETLYRSADVLDTFIYRFGIGQGQFALGTAIGLFANVINVILLLTANTVIKKFGGNALY